MSIQRVPSVPFTQIANSALRDQRLSFKARGVLALVLSNVGEWNATLAWLVNQSDTDGRASVQAALNELTELGYRVVTKVSRGRDDLQTIVTWHHVPESAINRPTKESTVENIDRRKSGGSLEEHSLEHHVTEQQVEVLNAHSTDFDEFWTAYPRKVGKGQARKAWAKAVKQNPTTDLITAAVGFRQWCEREQTETQFIPHPATWLNGERWLDELVTTKKHDRMDAHMAHIQELWENEPVENPQKQLEG